MRLVSVICRTDLSYDFHKANFRKINAYLLKSSFEFTNLSINDAVGIDLNPHYKEKYQIYYNLIYPEMLTPRTIDRE